MARRAAVAGRHARPGAGRFILDELARWRAARSRLVARAGDAVRQLDRGGPAAGLSGDLAIEETLGSLMRWNALAMVARANAAYGELGGHIASYASAADLFEVGFNHFFQARRDAGGDLVFFQPHSAPGVIARASSKAA
jgi:pyruvate dehydrogenase E1 component